jgi:hypothetical protein
MWRSTRERTEARRDGCAITWAGRTEWSGTAWVRSNWAARLTSTLWPAGRQARAYWWREPGMERANVCWGLVCFRHLRMWSQPRSSRRTPLFPVPWATCSRGSRPSLGSHSPGRRPARRWSRPDDRRSPTPTGCNMCRCSPSASHHQVGHRYLLRRWPEATCRPIVRNVPRSSPDAGLKVFFGSLASNARNARSAPVVPTV